MVLTIYFLSDSAKLVPSQRVNLDTLATFLGKSNDRTALIIGHTALAKSASGRQRLSEERAKVVADYLIKLGLITRDRITMVGMSSKKPMAENDTEYGMMQNRRVQVIIWLGAGDSALDLDQFHNWGTPLWAQ
jgi:outer membrane protein OmpA-like peptidoglycan-associated protein